MGMSGGLLGGKESDLEGLRDLERRVNYRVPFFAMALCSAGRVLVCSWRAVDGFWG